MQDIHYLVPEQENGFEKNLFHKITLDTVENAEDWFVDAKERLLDVNNWANYGSQVKAVFQVTDSHGKSVKRHVRKDDNICIDIPNGINNCMHVDAVEYDDYPDLSIESFALRVRPINNIDGTDGTEAARVFTSTFVVERRGRQIMAHYHGRNKDAEAAGAWMGVPDEQWTNLVTALIEIDPE